MNNSRISRRAPKLVRPSENVYEAYLIKAKNCVLAAKVLHKEGLHENSITQSYYAMYNSILAILYACGIKSEDHNQSIELFETLFDQKELSQIVKKAKKERIDKQYYLTNETNESLTKDVSESMIRDAEQVLAKIRLFKQNISEEKVASIREKISAHNTRTSG